MNYTLTELLKTSYFFLSASFKMPDGSRKRLPRVIQLPITYRCNSKCVMCNIWQMDHSNEMTLDEFSKFIKDPVFSKVNAVGINGGEPSLIKELPDFTREILTLPAIKQLNIISHGFNKKLLLASLEKMYALCKEKKVSFHISISLDGYGEMHNTVRGLNVFKLTTETILEIQKNKHQYCDSFDLGCTVVKQNVEYLKELDAFVRLHELNIKYRLGIENKRIESDKLVEQYSLLHHQILQSAKEFFHSRYLLTKEIKRKFKYFAIYYYLTAFHPKRLMGCHWKDNGITMDSRGELYYCAVASEPLGSLREKNGKEIFFSDKNIQHRKNIITDKCDTCIHDYDGKPSVGNLFIFLKAMLFENFFWVKYYYKSRMT